MNKVALISAAGAGGLLLFSAAYIGFAKMNGAPLHELPVFGSLFPKPEPTEAENADAAKAKDEHADSKSDAKGETKTDAKTAENTSSEKEHATDAASKQDVKKPRVEKTADLLSVFQLESPYSADELRSLVDTLKQKNQDLDKRLAEVAAKEELVADRLDVLQEREKALDKLKTQLEAQKEELDARAEELNHDSKASKDQDERAVKALGQLFADGEPDQLASKLVSYGAKEGAKILATLQPDRAKELLDALPQAKWREFAEAYTRLASAPKKDK